MTGPLVLLILGLVVAHRAASYVALALRGTTSADGSTDASSGRDDFYKAPSGFDQAKELNAQAARLAAFGSLLIVIIVNTNFASRAEQIYKETPSSWLALGVPDWFAGWMAGVYGGGLVYVPLTLSLTLSLTLASLGLLDPVPQPESLREIVDGKKFSASGVQDFYYLQQSFCCRDLRQAICIRPNSSRSDTRNRIGVCTTSRHISNRSSSPNCTWRDCSTARHD